MIKIEIAINHPLVMTLTMQSNSRIIGLWGRSGVGKTTILRSIAGWNSSLKGDIEIDGDIWQSLNFSLPVKDRKVFYLSQKSTLFDHLNVEQNLAMCFSNKEQKEKLKDVVDSEIVDLLKRPINKLSGGELKKVLMTQAFLLMPKVLILDEAFNGLDESASKKWWNKVLEFSAKNQGVIFLVSHQISELLNRVESVISFKNEKWEYFNSREMFLNSLTRSKIQSSIMTLKNGTHLSSDLNEWKLGTQKIVLSKKLIKASDLAFLEIKAGDVSISLCKIKGISIRNQLEATVKLIEMVPDEAVKVCLEIENQILWVEISRESIEFLALKVKMKVFALIKSNLNSIFD